MMSGPGNIFDLGKTAMSAQMVRMNTLASNIANAGSVASSPEEAYRAMRPVFETEYSGRIGDLGTLATSRAVDVVQLDREPEPKFLPDHPLADANGFVYASTVNVEEEMVEMMEASREYQNTLEAVSTMRTLMSRTVAMGK
jgi:flagellar basal-body rod protein FlgC